jgi:hypothetical protein
VLDVRVDHGAIGILLQVRQLRHDERLRISGPFEAGLFSPAFLCSLPASRFPLVLSGHVAVLPQTPSASQRDSLSR